MRELGLTEMEQIEGGYECQGLGAGLGGAAVIIGVSAWWTGVGTIIPAVLGVAAIVANYYCE
jgi:hypothetical protein